jgi:hypothetical protein
MANVRLQARLGRIVIKIAIAEMVSVHRQKMRTIVLKIVIAEMVSVRRQKMHQIVI